MTRGDVVIVEFPYADGHRGKNRPALVVQNDRDNQRLTNTVVAMISGNTRYASEPTQLLIDPSTSEGHSSGLHGPSVVKCCNLYTVRQQDILRVIGHLSDPLLADADQCLKAALDLG
ncbi:MAG: type II toxin-antitoxin system PemK/MazF family toxin [Planctomycetaceae bacterium]